MAEEVFGDTLMRFVAAELHFANLMTASREMFGRGYFSLGAEEKTAVDNAAFGAASALFQWMTQENLADKEALHTVGFRPHTTTRSSEES